MSFSMYKKNQIKKSSSILPLTRFLRIIRLKIKAKITGRSIIGVISKETTAKAVSIIMRSNIIKTKITKIISVKVVTIGKVTIKITQVKRTRHNL